MFRLLLSANSPWPYIKAVAAHLGADYGWQSGEQAAHKGHDQYHRSRHALTVMVGHLACAMTSGDVPFWRSLLYIVINGGTHYLIDSKSLPKWQDQLAHNIIALASARLLDVRGTK